MTEKEFKMSLLLLGFTLTANRLGFYTRYKCTHNDIVPMLIGLYPNQFAKHSSKHKQFMSIDELHRYIVGLLP